MTISIDIFVYVLLHCDYHHVFNENITMIFSTFYSNNDHCVIFFFSWDWCSCMLNVHLPTFSHFHISKKDTNFDSIIVGCYLSVLMFYKIRSDLHWCFFFFDLCFCVLLPFSWFRLVMFVIVHFFLPFTYLLVLLTLCLFVCFSHFTVIILEWIVNEIFIYVIWVVSFPYFTDLHILF